MLHLLFEVRTLVKSKSRLTDANASVGPLASCLATLIDGTVGLNEVRRRGLVGVNHLWEAIGPCRAGVNHDGLAFFT
jgi:hypothetical protein